jgi:hypothetical protein
LLLQFGKSQTEVCYLNWVIGSLQKQKIVVAIFFAMAVIYFGGAGHPADHRDR